MTTAPMNEARRREMAERVFAYMRTIEAQFKPGVRVTIIARMPDDERGDFLASTDTIDDIRALLDRIHTEPFNPETVA